MNDIISIDTLSTIRARLEAEKAEISLKIENYTSIVCTRDSIQAVKAARAELNNRFKEYEDQRKRLKTALSKQYDDFLVIYKENISTPLELAESRFKLTVDEYENSVKATKEAEIREHFTDYLLNYPNIDFLNFEQVGLNITKTANSEMLKQQCRNFIDKVADDIEMFQTQANQAEILVEYMQTLNASQAITSVAAKHKAIEMQKAAIEARTQVYKPIPEAIPEPVAEPEAVDESTLQKIAFVNYKSGHPEGGFDGQKYSYLIPDGVEYFAGQVLDVETRGGIQEAQIVGFGTIEDVPTRVIPFLKSLPVLPIDDFEVPDPFDDFTPPLVNAAPATRAKIRFEVSDSVEKIDELFEFLKGGRYDYREI